MIPILAIPHFNRPDLLLRCLMSIDCPVDKLVITQNGPDKFMPKDVLAWVPDCVNKTVIIKHPNAGVAGAWNEVIKLFPAPYWMLVNNDIQFSPGDLAKMEAAINGREMELAAVYATPAAHYTFFIVTARGVDHVGLFDENIFPAYTEDIDYERRMRLLGEKSIEAQGVAAIHGDAARGHTGSCTIHSDPALLVNNGRTHAGNWEYFERKWGGRNGAEQFDRPFNNPNWPLWAWRFEPAFRAKQQWEYPE